MMIRVISILVVGLLVNGTIAHAATLPDIIEYIARSSGESGAVISQQEGTAHISKTSIQDPDHQEILDSFRDKDYLTREQFAYLLNLLTSDIETVRDMERCKFVDYDTAQTLMGLSAVHTLCHKGIVRGSKQSYYYSAKLTEAEAVTMIIRARFLDDYASLKAAERRTPSSIRYRPYYQKARAVNALTNDIDHEGTLDAMTPFAAIKLLQHNFGSIDQAVSHHPLSSIMYQSQRTEKGTHIIRWVRDIVGQQIHIDDDNISVMLDPYWSELPDEDITVTRRCVDLNNCLTKIEFSIDRETDRSRYCGMISYTIDTPYRKHVSDHFCLDK